jgi:hypothetical protein
MKTSEAQPNGVPFTRSDDINTYGSGVHLMVKFFDMRFVPSIVIISQRRLTQSSLVGWWLLFHPHSIFIATGETDNSSQVPPIRPLNVTSTRVLRTCNRTYKFLKHILDIWPLASWNNSPVVSLSGSCSLLSTLGMIRHLRRCVYLAQRA